MHVRTPVRWCGNITIRLAQWPLALGIGHRQVRLLCRNLFYRCWHSGMSSLAQKRKCVVVAKIGSRALPKPSQTGALNHCRVGNFNCGGGAGNVVGLISQCCSRSQLINGILFTCILTCACTYLLGVRTSHQWLAFSVLSSVS